MFSTENDVFVFYLKLMIWKGFVDAPIGLDGPPVRTPVIHYNYCWLIMFLSNKIVCKMFPTEK